MQAQWRLTRDVSFGSPHVHYTPMGRGHGVATRTESMACVLNAERIPPFAATQDIIHARFTRLCRSFPSLFRYAYKIGMDDGVIIDGQVR